MSRYVKMTRVALAKELRRRRVVPSWTTNYMSKSGLVKVLEFSDTNPGVNVRISDKDLARLEAKREAHKAKTKTAKKERAARYGTDNLTRREILLNLVNSTPGLRFAEKRVYDEPFDSPTGNTRATVANVFVDDDGNEYNFTRAECSTMHKDMGVDMPKVAFQHARKPTAEVARSQGKKTFGDLW